MKNRCFVIGPMNKRHIDLLKWLAYEVIAKILEKEDFEVFTPDVPAAGNIMHHIIRSCDRAQIVVADTTGNNPNVLYEMAVLDAMGRACIPIKILGVEKIEKDFMPFDRAQYRYFEIEPKDTKKAIKTLEPVINWALQAQQAGDLLENPLTDYFGVPLSSFSSSHGIARGYYFNLVCPCIEGEIFDGPEFAKGKSNLTLETIIPDELENATRSAVDELIQKKIFIPVSMQAPGRKVNIYIWSNKLVPTESPIVVDIPTALATLRNNVFARLGRNVNPDPKSADFREIQYDEISQFKRYLRRFVDTEQDSLGRRIRKNFKILDEIVIITNETVEGKETSRSLYWRNYYVSRGF